MRWVMFTACLIFSHVVLAQPGPKVGHLAPNLQGETLSGEPFNLSDDLAHAKVINFFWIECQPCKEEMPELAALEKSFPEIKFIAVHTRPEFLPVVAQFIKSLPAAPSLVVVPASAQRTIFNYIGVPHTIVLNRQNVVKANLAGYTRENMKLLKQLLKKMEP